MIMSKSDHNNEDDHHDHDQINRPASASMEPVPAYFFAESVKKQLPVMPYKTILEKNGEVYDEDKGCVCIICLNRTEGSHEVRVPFNCCHVFHRECLDVWVDQGHGTCPLCRSKLLPTQNHHHDFHDNHDQADRDPWRRERMIYLFGDDFLFDDDD
ncbi:hypothetical protein TIFTF001_013489 [Ficus carica]|uniref:RING-type domain-containing protein n=1 Tax=Ficus carica TaxID=3494 RepID=A0AA88D633_FICCA|nr:hypothetical protein TIFTF001_013489 [Ficus carica]